MSDPQDPLTQQLTEIEKNLPEPQTLTHEELLDLINQLGPRTCRQVLNARKTLGEARIYFLFNSLPTQKLVNLLHNDQCHEILAKLEQKKPK